ncbi:hypothetical protein HS99_0004015 [Kitasatospora aureofaciens]|uniref:Uncharacterized protein n=1 Tax=Kitasatospora aureofaciens TaxID=1894 RepID=A0A1E7N8I1_KITAU|nr:hypothetical protein B6264_24995 [Kitasatospora aureofaciens]OEV37006.1 hypothetical protein HS99_0004015 [Kitasatospora aureofaciens]
MTASAVTGPVRVRVCAVLVHDGRACLIRQRQPADHDHQETPVSTHQRPAQPGDQDDAVEPAEPSRPGRTAFPAPRWAPRPGAPDGLVPSTRRGRR